MKELMLLRHAKSDWNDPTLSDHERPLSGRGRRAAPAMGQRMLAEGAVPDLVYCSTSRRTRETWALLDGILDASGIRPLVEYREELYLASPRVMIEVARSTAPSVERLMIVAHNPGTHELAIALAGSGEKEALDRLDWKYPTGALSRFRFEIDRWSDLSPGIGDLIDFLRPKDLDRADELDL